MSNEDYIAALLYLYPLLIPCTALNVMLLFCLRKLVVMVLLQGAWTLDC